MLHQRLLAKLPEQELLRKFNSAVLEQLHVRIHPAIDRHRDAPWPRKHLRVFDGDFVTDDVWRLERKTLDEMQGVAMEVSGAVEPVPAVEIRDVHHQRVAVPSSDRMP